MATKAQGSAAKKHRGTRMISTSIDGSTYSINTLPASEGIRAAIAVAKVIGGSFDMMQQDFDLAKFAALLDESHIELAKNLLNGLACDDVEIDFDDHFSGGYDTLLRVLGWVIQENFLATTNGALNLTTLVQQVQRKSKLAMPGLQVPPVVS